MAKRSKNKKTNNFSLGNIKRKEVKIKKVAKQYPKCDNSNNLKIPNDTCSVITNLGLEKIDNFHLKLNKFAKYSDELERFIFDENIEEFDFNNYKDISDDYRDILNQLYSDIKSFKFKTDYRLLIGSEQSIYETSIRLHHIYGIPYIPASAIKGVVRSYIIIEKFESQEEKALENEGFKRVFGSQEQEGRVIFFDAFPTTKPTIKVDIMNPHYGHYYNEVKAPTDTNNPVPINFLTVENTTFEFFIASTESLDSFEVEKKILEVWFKKALTEHGIGAKTAVGYGYFE